MLKTTFLQKCYFTEPIKLPRMACRVLFFVLLYLFVLTPYSSVVLAFEDGACFGNDSIALFRHSAGGLEANFSSVERCVESCADMEMPYAAVVNKAICLCAFQEEGMALESEEPRNDSLCQLGTNGFFRAYKGTIIRAVKGLQLLASPEIGYVDEAIAFNISLLEGIDVEFMFDFGDDSTPTAWNLAPKTTHTYRGSGYYKVKLFARQASKPQRRVIITSMVMKVVDKLGEQDFDFQCFPVIEPDEDSGCNATALAGQDIHVVVDFNDTLQSVVEFDLPDTKFHPFGPEIASTLNATYETAPEGMIIMSESARSFQAWGSLQAVEGISETPGDFEMVIYRPFCGSNTKCNLGIISCSPPQIFCFRSKTCVPSDPPRIYTDHDQCRQQIDIFPEYKVIRRVKITVTKGYFFYRLMKTRVFQIGDLIAFKAITAKMAVRELQNTENPDYLVDVQTEKDPPQVIRYEQMKPINGKKFLVRMMAYETSQFYLPHPFHENGDYFVKMTVTSPWINGNYTYERKISVQTPIDRIRLRIVPPNASVKQKVDVSIKINGGSDVILKWDFGDGIKAEEKVVTVRTGQKLSQSHEYLSPGVYKVFVSAGNLQNNYNTSQIVSVQHPITNDWQLTTSSPQLLPGQVVLTLSYSASSNLSRRILPTNGTAIILFGDGKEMEWKIPENEQDFPNSEAMFYHEYTYPGKYKVIVTMSNLVSSITLKTDVYLLRKISGFAVATTFLDAGGNRVTPYGDLGEKFPISGRVDFNFSCDSGDIEKYIVYVNGKQHQETKESSFTFTEPSEGWNNFTFYAYNKIQGKSEPVDKNIYFMVPVSGIKISDISNDTSQPNLKIFNVSLAQLGTDSCVLIDFGDSRFSVSTQTYQAYGDNKTCSQALDQVVKPDLYFYAGHIAENSQIITTHTYPGPDDYILTVTAVNSITSPVKTQLTITVIEIDCDPPVVKIFNAARDQLNATQVWKSKPVQLYSHAAINCNATITVSKYWECFMIEPFTGRHVRTIDLSKSDSYRKTQLYVAPFFLERGMYEFRFVVNLTNHQPHPLLPFHELARTFVEIVRSPIVGKMTEGAESRVIRGWGQRLMLDPARLSIDPDDEKNKDFNVTWFCRRLSGERIDRQISDEDMPTSQPIKDRSLITEDLGGCFSKGPGKILVESGLIDWPTSVFSRPGFTYEILIRIDAFDRISSWTGIQMVLMERSPPSVVIRCQTASLCYPHLPIGQKINPVRVGLIGVCSESCDGQLLYEWSVFAFDPDTGDEIELPDGIQYLVGASGEKVALSKDFFDQYYPKYGDFSIKLSVVNDRGDRGVSDIFLHINQPPEGGDCNITSTGPTALIDQHHVSCWNWFDPEFKPIDYYAFWILDLAKGTISYLTYGPRRKVALVLPVGHFILGVDIKDKEGAVIRVNITEIVSKVPTQQQFDAYMEMKSLEIADASGDQAQMSMIAQAVSSLMNLVLPDEKELTTTTTTTTSTTTTAKPFSNRTKSEAQIAEEAKTRTRMVDSVESIMNTDTLVSLEQVGSVLSAIAGRGKGVDNEAKEKVIRLLKKTINMASSIEVESPQQLLDFCMFAVGTMGAIVNRMTEQLIKRVVLPTDRSRAWEIEYSVEIPDYGESKDYIFDGQSTQEEALAKAVIQNERLQGEHQIKTMVQLTIDLVLSMLRNIVVGEKPLTFSASSGLSFTIEMFNGGSLSNKSIKHGDAEYIFPQVCSILVSKEQCYGNETLGLMAVSWPAILESFGNSVHLLSENTQTLQLILLDETLHVLDVSNTTDMFSIIVPRTTQPEDSENDIRTDLELELKSPKSPQLTTDFIHPELKFYENMMYHQFLVTKSYSAVNIEITLTNPKAELIFFLNHRYKPLVNHHEISIPLRTINRKRSHTFDIFLGNDMIRNRTGFFYLGIAAINITELVDSEYASLLDGIIINHEFSWESNGTSQMNPPALNFTENYSWIARDFQTNYSVQIYTSGCYFFDYDRRVWSGDGCYVKSADRRITHCRCNHLTSFGSGFFVMPNTIDFSYVFANAGFVDNVTIYMTVVVTLTIYVLLVIWARYADRKSVKQLGATPMSDNNPKDKYLYEIQVFTGDRDGAGTDSKVSFILSGDDDETQVRTFADPHRKILRRGAQDIFVMAVPRKLGRLTYLRIWHDNSGKGKFRSWFLSFIVVRDVQTGEKFEFICNKWLAVEKGDGSIDRLIPVAGIGEATQFTHLFNQRRSKNLKDGHLWFSIFLCPLRTRFTRVQRVSCCISMLYLSMLVNAMWYQRAPPKPRTSALEIGPFTLSPEQIGIGFMSNLIVFPITFLIVTLFRKARLRRRRPSRLTEAAKRQGVDLKLIESKRHRTKVHSLKSSATSEKVSTIGGASSLFEMEPKRKVVKKSSSNKIFLLPWWCRIIAWILCITSIIVSIFFLWAYGIQFGDEKTRKWVTSLIVSFFASVLVTQPFKILLTAMILSTIFKSPDAEFDDSEEDEEKVNLQLEADEEWLHGLANMSPTRATNNRSNYYRMPDLSILEQAKLERLKEIKMGEILKGIISYLIFLWLLIVLSYGNRDPNAFLIKDAIKSYFIDGAASGVSFTSVRTSDELWNWVNKTLLPELSVGPWYNNFQPYGLRGFLNDRVSRIMGYGILRTVRIRPETCSVLPEAKVYLGEDILCRDYGNLIYEDRKSYDKGWMAKNRRSMVIASSSTSQQKMMDDGESQNLTLSSNGSTSDDWWSVQRKHVDKMDSLMLANASLVDHLHDPSLSLALHQRHHPDDDTRMEEYDEDEDDTLEEGIITRLDDDIVLVNPSKSKKSPWTYRKSSELDGLLFWGKLDIYSGGGYTFPLRGSRESLTTKVTSLKENHWIDGRTRAVFAEFSAYNPQVNLFPVVTILAEFLPGGGVVTNYRIDVVRLIRYHQGFGLFVILCELTYFGFIFYFTFRETKSMRREGFRYFTSYWNWAEVLVLFFSYSAIGLYIYRTVLTNRILRIFDRTHGNGYIKLQFVAFVDELFGYAMAFTMFIAILKFIRLIRFNKRMGLLYSTLNQCSKDLKSFCIVFLVVFFAFVQLFYLLFGIHMQDFSSFVSSVETTFGMVTGKFNFDEMVSASPLLGPVTFFAFVLIAQIVLVNVFLTLIISAFETVKHDILKQNNDFEIVQFAVKKMKELLGIDDPVNRITSKQSNVQSNEIHDIMRRLPDKVDKFLAQFGDLNGPDSGLQGNLWGNIRGSWSMDLGGKDAEAKDDMEDIPQDIASEQGTFLSDGQVSFDHQARLPLTRHHHRRHLRVNRQSSKENVPNQLKRQSLMSAEKKVDILDWKEIED